ncbi:hypothetical protein Cch01nite_05970 [Cellulomonas chitinilytica]|uniref:Uncharacterized protein n=1 Tax=Cellulomonas chitinilytica TaxID=398759 RepID=A0A919P119_9CELL|nr:hypothetical protein [Cellulomonas chitinilytica]GIG19873.1 hypothetical protein Cch01nite_05970 [Cellulomonas chitinilytica]
MHPELPEADRAPSAKPYLWVLGLTIVLPMVLVAVGWLVLPHHNPPGQCDGIGFGCVPNPADGLLIVSMIVVLPACVLVAGAACATIAITRAVRGRRARR